MSYPRISLPCAEYPKTFPWIREVGWGGAGWGPGRDSAPDRLRPKSIASVDVKREIIQLLGHSLAKISSFLLTKPLILAIKTLATLGVSMYFPNFDAFEGTIIYAPIDGPFGLVKITTPNGTATPDTEVCYIWHSEGRNTPDVTKTEYVHFTAGSVARRFKVGDKVLFKAITQDGLGLLRAVGTWIFADAFHQALSKLPEFRIIGSRVPRYVAGFGNIHAALRRHAEDPIVMDPEWRWQTRPGRGARDYEGYREAEIERGWEDCPNPIQDTPVQPLGPPPPF
jgi:hypothetical protein